MTNIALEAPACVEFSDERLAALEMELEGIWEDPACAEMLRYYRNPNPDDKLGHLIRKICARIVRRKLQTVVAHGLADALAGKVGTMRVEGDTPQTSRFVETEPISYVERNELKREMRMAAGRAAVVADLEKDALAKQTAQDQAWQALNDLILAGKDPDPRKWKETVYMETLKASDPREYNRIKAKQLNELYHTHPAYEVCREEARLFRENFEADNNQKWEDRWTKEYEEIEAILAREAAAKIAEVESVEGFRESDYLKVVRLRTGLQMDDETRGKAAEAREKQYEQSVKVACALESSGLRGFGDGPQMWIVDLILQRAIACPGFAKSVLIPASAEKARGKMRKLLKFFLNLPDHEFDQMVTFTWGQRVPIRTETNGAELRAASGDLSRRISIFNRLKFMRDYYAQIQFRANECGELKRDAEGNPTAHLHSHTITHFGKWLPRNWDGYLGKTEKDVRDKFGPPSRIIFSKRRTVKMLVYRPSRKQGRDGTRTGRFLISQKRKKGIVIKTKGAMAEWCHMVDEKWGSEWQIDGAIEGIQEVTKYTMKGDDLVKLSTNEMKALASAMFKMRRVQKMGEFRTEAKRLWEECKRIEMVKQQSAKAEKRAAKRAIKEAGKNGDVLTPIELHDWNCQSKTRKKTDPEKEQEKDNRVRKKMYREKMTMPIDPNVQADGHVKRFEQFRAQAEFKRAVEQLRAGVPVFMSPIPVPPPPDAEARTARRKKNAGCPAFQNRIVARLTPSWWHRDQEFATPAFAVWSDSPPDIEQLIADKKFAKDAVGVAREWYKRTTGRKAVPVPSGMRVHTSPITGRNFTEHLPGFLQRETWEPPEKGPETPPKAPIDTLFDLSKL